jgi:hypothetical protein
MSYDLLAFARMSAGPSTSPPIRQCRMRVVSYGPQLAGPAVPAARMQRLLATQRDHTSYRCIMVWSTINQNWFPLTEDRPRDYAYLEFSVTHGRKLLGLAIGLRKASPSGGWYGWRRPHTATRQRIQVVLLCEGGMTQPEIAGDGVSSRPFLFRLTPRDCAARLQLIRNLRVGF